MVRLAAEAYESEPEQDEDTTYLDQNADENWRDDQNEISAGRERTVTLPSVPVMTGTHFHSIDDKGRVIIPAKLRPALTDQFWMMRDENDNISIYNYETGLNILANCERLMGEFPDDEELASAVERTTSATDLVTVESGYRVAVSDMLQMYAELEKEVVTVGFLNHAVLWNRARWEKFEAQKLQSQQSPEVRKRQASLMRAGASQPTSQRKRYETEAREEIEHHELAATGSDRSIGGLSELGRRRPTAPVQRKVASASDGDRSPRVLALSQIGRSRG